MAGVILVLEVELNKAAMQNAVKGPSIADHRLDRVSEQEKCTPSQTTYFRKAGSNLADSKHHHPQRSTFPLGTLDHNVLT